MLQQHRAPSTQPEKRSRDVDMCILLKATTGECHICPWAPMGSSKNGQNLYTSVGHCGSMGGVPTWSAPGALFLYQRSKLQPQIYLPDRSAPTRLEWNSNLPYKACYIRQKSWITYAYQTRGGVILGLPEDRVTHPATNRS